MKTLTFLLVGESVATLVSPKWECQTRTPENGSLESSGTPKNSEDDLKDQNTLPRNIPYIVGKIFKLRCLQCPRILDLDIYTPSYGQKKGRESNCQFNSRPLKAKINQFPMSNFGVQYVIGKISTRATTLVQTLLQSEVKARSYDLSKSQESEIETLWWISGLQLGSPGKKKPIWM
jgi:hypothetical protein